MSWPLLTWTDQAQVSQLYHSRLDYLMAGPKRINGHKPSGLLNILDPSLKLAPHPSQENVEFDLDEGLSSIVRLSSDVPSDAFSARSLGTERQGNAILLNDDGILLTIGYLVVDAHTITLHANGERDVRAELVGYNHETGFALLHALSPLDTKRAKIGTAVGLEVNEPVIIAPYGGVDHAISGTVVSRREFAGSWEYMLDSAIFTAPIHPNWSGAALLRTDGSLCGVGSLWINDAEEGGKERPGNMFVPIDLLTPIYENMVSTGLAPGPYRPWLGMYTSEAMNRLFVSGVIPDAPADLAGVEAGDIVYGINDEAATSLSVFYRKLWSAGEAGTTIVLNLRRDGEDFDLTVESNSRYSFMEKRSSH